jgi:hypothetical protein
MLTKERSRLLYVEHNAHLGKFAVTQAESIAGHGR